MQLIKFKVSNFKTIEESEYYYTKYENYCKKGEKNFPCGSGKKYKQCCGK